MAHWNGSKIVYFKPFPHEDYPDWDVIDCGCCAGIEWGGEEPNECKRCSASGAIYKHRKSGVTAEYPGGRFT
jgi:hypothetical protein